MLGLGERPDPNELGKSIEHHWNEARAAADGRTAAGHLKQAYRSLRTDTGIAFKAIPEAGYGSRNVSRTITRTAHEKRLGTATMMWYEASKSAVDQLKRSAKEAGAKKQQKWSPSPPANGSVQRWRESREKSMSLLAAQQGTGESPTRQVTVADAANLRSSASGRTPSTGTATAPSTVASRRERPLADRQLTAQPKAKSPGR